MTDCLFCKMVKGDIQAATVYEDDDVLAFNDINPQAPTHILIIPKKHIATLNDVEDADTQLLGKLSSVAANIATSSGFAEDGYRVVMNCNQAGGQAVYHIHLHLLAGRQMSWPPG
jgi:histidine triad (HIT) family protein